jgi:hypothetical protein
MAKRYGKRDHIEKNRKQRKARWINAKNNERKYPDCAYSGDFYCNHVYDPQYPWVWVDFRFFHSRLKKYFAVAMVTAEYEAYCDAESKAYEDANYPNERLDFVKSEKHPTMGQLYQLAEPTDAYKAAEERQRALKARYIAETWKVAPSIEVKDYGPVAVGVYATVNREHIDEQVIRDFIAHFRSLGEPTTPGWTWKGQEVEVVPQILDIRYERRTEAA